MLESAMGIFKGDTGSLDSAYTTAHVQGLGSQLTAF